MLSSFHPLHSIFSRQRNPTNISLNPSYLPWFSLSKFFPAHNYAMEALNVASLSPLALLSDRKNEPRKHFSLPSAYPLKLPTSSISITSKSNLRKCVSSSVNGGLVLLSSALNTGIAGALTYDEALQQSLTSSPFKDFDVTSVLNSFVNFGVESPVVVVGGAALLALPLILSQILGKPKAWGVESARNTYAKLRAEGSAQLLDIRSPADIKRAGSPDLRGLKKKGISIFYKGDDKQGFLKKLSLKFKQPETTTLFILDKFDGNSELVAELATVNGFKAAYGIKDGAEGPRGWVKSGLPWIEPGKAFSVDFGGLTDAITDVFGEGTDGLGVALGIATATGLGLVAFQEVELILQLLGSAALFQLASKKLLFAEDRKKTLQEVDEFLNTKIAPKQLVDEMKQIGAALLPTLVATKSLPAPTDTSAGLPVTTSETAPPELKVDAGFAKEINSVPKPEVKAEPISGFSDSHSPYPYYPDFKPPSSPSPSQP